jgi:hypothetical protein
LLEAGFTNIQMHLIEDKDFREEGKLCSKILKEGLQGVSLPVTKCAKTHVEVEFSLVNTRKDIHDRKTHA